jgi:DNA-directed RNA polymerase beta' subunit
VHFAATPASNVNSSQQQNQQQAVPPQRTTRNTATTQAPKLDPKTLDDVWQSMKQARSLQSEAAAAAPPFASAASPPKTAPNATPTRAARPPSLFKQQRELERELELESVLDDPLDYNPSAKKARTTTTTTTTSKPARNDPDLIAEERAFTIDVRRVGLPPDGRLLRPHNADAPRGEHAPEADVANVTFDMLTEAEVRAMSVRRITTQVLLNTENSVLTPHNDGPLSEYLGPIERTSVCMICHGSRETPAYLTPCGERFMCDGHFGSIELSAALFQPEMADVLMSTLRFWCWHCGQLPGDDEQNARVVRQLSTPDAQGRLKNRAERLAVLNAAYGKRLTCAQCFKDEEARENVRCANCVLYCAARNRLSEAQRAAGVTIKHPVEPNGQCPMCEHPTQFRPTITKLHRRPFDGFPYLVHWQMPKGQGWAGMRRTGALDVNGEEILEAQTKTDRYAEAFENYCARYGIKNREFEMSPERARKIIKGIGHTPALLLAIDGTYHDAATGLVDTTRYTQSQLSSAKRAVVEWLEAMAPRVLPYSPNLVRQTDTSEGLAKARLNELTTATIDLMRADDRLRATQLSTDQAHQARERGIGNGILEFNASEPWYGTARADALAVGQVAELYGRVQYYYAILARPTKAPFWLPTENRSIKVPDKARKGAERTKNKGRGYISDLGGKDGFMRRDTQGSRCDFSFRSVIVPDPLLDLDQCGITRETAERLSTPVQLCAINIESVLRCAESLRRAVRARGRLFASLMIFDETRTQAIRYLELPNMTVYECALARIGSWVELPLEDGAIVVMNRQPSLHKSSMMAHRIRILPDNDEPLLTFYDVRREKEHENTRPAQYLTDESVRVAFDLEFNERLPADAPYRCSVRTSAAVRLHPNVVGPYNADFDGDEMTVRRAHTCLPR